MSKSRNEGQKIAVFVAGAVAASIIPASFSESPEIWLALSPAAGAGAYFIRGLFGKRNDPKKGISI